LPFPLIDIVEREKEKRRRRVFLRSRSNPGRKKQRSFALNEKPKASAETLKSHGFSSIVRNAIMLMTSVVSELFQT